MLIEFEDKSYIEFKQVNDKIFISIAAKDALNANKTIINSVEISDKQLKMVADKILIIESKSQEEETDMSVTAEVEKRGRGRPKKKVEKEDDE